MTTFNNTTKANNLYPVANAVTSSNPFVVEFQSRAPTVNDINYPIQKYWLDTSVDNFWFLKNFTSTTGIVLANWIQITSGTNPLDSIMVDTFTAPGTNPVFPDGSGIITITGGQVAAGTTANVIQTDATAADGPHKFSIEIQRSQAVAVSTIGDNGVSHFNSADFTVDANGFVSAVSPFAPFNYILLTAPIAPYVVTATDFYIATDTTAGSITIKLPDAPTTNRIFIIKDRFGQDAVNNVLVTTVTGAVTIDGLTTYTMNSNFQAINLLFNGTSYEVF